MSSKRFITIGTPTSTGGKVISASSDMEINGQKVSLIDDIATCNCGSKSCKGQGPIVKGKHREVSVDGVEFACEKDEVLAGCGNCFLLASPHDVTLGFVTGQGVSIGGNGGNVSIGNGIKMNTVPIGSNGGGMASRSAPANYSTSNVSQSVSSSMSNATAVPSASVPEINPNNMYWPPYNFLAEDGEKDIKVEYLVPPQNLAIFSVEEAKEFLQNLYNDMGGKEAISDAKSYKDLGFSGKEAIETAKGLGGLGVMAYTKNINGTDWIIIKNFKKHLKTLEKGHKWGANNPRIIQLGLGLNDLKGAMRYVRFNAGLDIAFSIGLNAADYILRDDATLAELGVNSAADITKGFISLFGAAIITATFPISLTAMGATMLFAIASFSIGYGLDSIDNETGFSSDLTQAVEDYFK